MTALSLEGTTPVMLQTGNSPLSEEDDFTCFPAALQQEPVFSVCHMKTGVPLL